MLPLRNSLRVRSKPQQRLVLWLCALALTFQALIPQGFMVGRDSANGAVAITLCTSAGDIAAFMGEDGQIFEADPSKEAPDNQNDHTGQKCIFAGHNVAVIAPNLAVTITFQDLQDSGKHLAKVATASTGTGLAAPPPPPTGPPNQA